MLLEEVVEEDVAEDVEEEEEEDSEEEEEVEEVLEGEDIKNGAMRIFLLTYRVICSSEEQEKKTMKDHEKVVCKELEAMK